jgi:YgiT-type zinc finger domain-containing protein
VKCSIRGCPGELEGKTVTHTVRSEGRLFVIDNVPAQVCSVCGDTLFSAAAVQRIQDIVQGRAKPATTAPVYDYAS